MKLFCTNVNILTLILVVGSFLAETPVTATSQDPQVDEKKALRRRLVVQSEGCILVEVDVRTGESTSESIWRCELQSSDADPAGILMVNVEGLDDIDLDAEVVSGQTTLLVEGAVIADGTLKIPKGARKTLGMIDKRGPSEAAKKARKGENNESRRLVPLVPDDRKVLAVRVIASDATTTASLTTLGGNIFGTGLASSTVSLTERYNACSYGETLITPFNGATPKVTIQNGITEVQISTTVNGVSCFDVETSVTNALRTYLGVSDLSTMFDHVMLCLPPGTMRPGKTNWYAYAYLNHWLSAYNDENCRYPSGLVHEIGHNLNLNHASEGIDEYGDQTGLMGYSYNSFTTKLCFNPAKSWQLGWYSNKQQFLDFNQQGGFAGSLVGINDYTHTGAVGKFVHLKIRGSAEDLYVGFNVDQGINVNTQEAWDMVTVQGQLGTGKSYLRAKLGTGNKYIVTDFIGSKDLIVEVTAISLSTSPPYANVIVQLEGCPPGFCSVGCNAPCPTPPPTTPPPTTAPPTTPPPTTPPPTTAPPTTPPPTTAPPTTPPPTTPPAPVDVFPVQGFESGFGIFKTDGSLAKISTKVFMTGTRSLEIKSYLATSLVYTITDYFVGNYQTLQIDFGYKPVGLKAGDSFFIEISSNNGSTWQTIREFKQGVDWTVDNKFWYSGLTTWTNSAQRIKLRIRGMLKSTKLVYIDNVSLKGR